MSTAKPPFEVAVIGFGWMGRVHAQAYGRVPHHYADLPFSPRLRAIADDVPGRAAAAAAQFGALQSFEDWRELIAAPEIEAVSVTAPNFLHREIGIAVVEAGKHLWIEKPVGLSADDARAVQQAAAQSGVQVAVGFNYRNPPAVQLARTMIAAGELGRITHATFRMLSDYAAHPDGALSWRFQRARGGNGVLGDLVSHGVDLVAHLLGPIREVVADTATFVTERAIPTGATAGHQRASGGVLGPVENEDWMGSQLVLVSGARVSLEASRVATGEQNNYSFEIHGARGRIAWDFRRQGELVVSLSDDRVAFQDLPRTLRLVGPEAPDFAAFQPGSAQPMSYDDLKVIEAHRFLTSIATGTPTGATIDDAVRSAVTLDALAESAASRHWVSL